MANNVNVVNRGFEYVCQWMSGTSTTSNWTFPTFVGWGTANGSNATSTVLPLSAPAPFPPGPSTAGTGAWYEIAPYFEAAEARVAGTASVTNNTVASSYSTMQVTATITSGSGQSIGESFLVFKSTKPASSSVATGTMTNVQTNLTTATAIGIAAPYYIQVSSEVMNVTSTAASNVLNVTRGVNGSVAIGHQLNEGVTLGNVPGALGGNPNNGDMFAHAGFQALALNNGDSIAFTWQINVTS